MALIAYKSMNTNRHMVGYELNNQRVCNPGTGCACLISVNDAVIAFEPYTYGLYFITAKCVFFNKTVVKSEIVSLNSAVFTVYLFLSQ